MARMRPVSLGSNHFPAVRELKIRNIAEESGWDNNSETGRAFLRQVRSSDPLVEMSDRVRRLFEERAGSILELYGYPLVGHRERMSGGSVAPPGDLK